MEQGEGASRFVEPRLGIVLAIWWAWTWRWVLYALGWGVVLYLPMLGLSLMLGGSNFALTVVTFLGQIFIFCAAQVYTLWNLFGQDFGDGVMYLESKEVTGTDPLFAPSLRDAIRVWWAWFWRQFVLSFGVAFVLGSVAQVAGMAAGLTLVGLSIAAVALNVVLSLAAAIFSLYLVLRHEFRHFRIRLLREGGGAQLAG